MACKFTDRFDWGCNLIVLASAFCSKWESLLWGKLGGRNVDWAGGAVKMLRAMEIYEKQKNRYQSYLLLFNNDLKNNKWKYRKFVWIRSW